MSFRKNAFSYFLWATYLITIGTAFTWYMVEKFKKGHITNPPLIFLFVSLSFVLEFLCFVGLRKLFLIKKSKSLDIRKIEQILVVLFLAGGFFIRIGNCEVSESSYYLKAMVTETTSIADITHGATQIYLWLLHFCFFIFGNKWMVGIILQLILQFLGCMLFYFIVRQISGIFPAIMFLAYEMFTPLEVSAGITYSPQMLYQLLYYLVFAFLLFTVKLYFSENPEKEVPYKRILFFSFASGLGIGIASYLDIKGLTLLLLLFCFSAVQNTDGISRKRKAKRKYCYVITIAITAILTFLLCIAYDAYKAGYSLWYVIKAWASLYRSNGFSFDFWRIQLQNEWVCFVMLILLSIMIYSFWCRNHQEKIRIWYLLFLSLGVIEVLKLQTQWNYQGSLFLIICSVITGIGIKEGLYKEQISEEMSPLVQMEGVVMQETTLDKKETEVEAEPKIQFIENPLPLPKKHVKKVMDYGFEPSLEQMKFDVDISSQDDFDIE
ncbi:hypothetical protein LJC58_00215 [Lachnospiraceae bacterium OttesenSCG-928-D06]|nr:hypothetical protein [Lachnospiraceae bacterium OttesenSCG-928-D06]